KRMLAFFGHGDVEEMLHQFTRRGGGPSRPGHTAAREVVAAALEGDVMAQEITSGQGVHLATYARAAAARVGFRVDRAEQVEAADGVEGAHGVEGEEVPIVLAGSVLTAPDSPVTSALVAELAETFPESRPRLATLPPVSGATLDALAEAGIAVTPAVVDRLRATAPPPAFLQT
ncbi:MAG TPA: hypothetical protein VE287_01950, partial [Actinopolymorphaceae bacterium]|nr:hypothetical protein [Actinopolymorphaceae bacterium]